MDAKQFQVILDKASLNLDSYEELYRQFHQNPEISTLEYETSKTIQEHLKKLSSKGELDVHSNIGGTGIIAICKNGNGPTVLLRADIDGMPVKEQTGLPYASTRTQKDNMDEQTKSVMHACGHDFHFTSLLAVADALLTTTDTWSGTVIFLFQPAEERGVGAQNMVDDGLFDPQKHSCPVPDVCLGQHVYAVRAGHVQTKSGPFFSAADSYKITIYGKGGHGSMPHNCIDPVVIASHIIVRLQTIVSREIPPDETAVITVGSLKSGNTVNVISDEAVLQVNVRSVTSPWRKYILDAIKRVVDGECSISRCPKPAKFEKLNSYPITDNDKDLTNKLAKSFDAYFEDRHEKVDKALMASEDFSHLASANGTPYVYWIVGGIDHATWDKHEKNGTLNEIPVNHSPFFAPCIEPTLRTGVEAMTVAALTFLGKGK